jgi:catechol 2,3-dioxygenase-like lactoylglutathione lyase family enzyme
VRFVAWMERSAIRDSRLWLPVFRYAPPALGMKDDMTNEQTTDRGQHTRSPFSAIRAIDYTVIFVRDMAAMRRFYEEVLAFPLLRELSPNWIEYGLGPNTLALARPSRTATDAPTPAGSAALQLAFKVSAAEVDACAEELVRHGVALLSPPTNQSFGHRTLFFRDPDGNLLEVYAEI